MEVEVEVEGTPTWFLGGSVAKLQGRLPGAALANTERQTSITVSRVLNSPGSQCVEVAGRLPDDELL